MPNSEQNIPRDVSGGFTQGWAQCGEEIVVPHNQMPSDEPNSAAVLKTTERLRARRLGLVPRPAFLDGVGKKMGGAQSSFIGV